MSTDHERAPITFEVSGDMDAEWERLRRRWAKEQRKHPTLLTPLPRRVRLRLAIARRRDGLAIWLVRHRRFRAAETLWRMTGGW